MELSATSDILQLVGRIMFVLIFLGSAIAHLTSKDMVAYAQMKNLPAPGLAVKGSGLLILAGALMIAFGFWADLGAILLVIFLVPTAFLMHNFWTVEDPQTRMVEMTQFQKNIALAGAALVMLVFFVAAGDDLGYTVGDMLLTEL